MKIRSFLPLLLLVAFHRSVAQTSTPSASPKTKIVGVYFFGYQADGLDVDKIREAISVRANQELGPDEKLGSRIRPVVEKLTGRPATDLALVCCDATGGSWLYIGLAGKSYHATSYNPAPQGAVRLPEAAMKLEEACDRAFQKAAEKGDFGEDDSQGYALSRDPETRATELAIRQYTLSHEDLVYQVLAGSTVVEHRQAASQFLGYATQSQRQIDALTRASHDADEGVRNNATRALGVLAEYSDKLARMIPAADFIDMANSGTWTDRNKGTFVLMTLTKSRDPKLLGQLRARAMPGLIEIARWDPGHAGFARMILGRIAGIDEESLGRMSGQEDQVEQIIALAQKGK